MQEGQNQNHFDPELTATAAKSGRQRQSGRTRQIANIVTQIGGFPVDDSPRELITMVNTLLASDSVREDFDGVPDEVCFRIAWLATGASFFCLLSESCGECLFRPRLSFSVNTGVFEDFEST
jgi:hypothetical protein